MHFYTQPSELSLLLFVFYVLNMPRFYFNESKAKCERVRACARVCVCVCDRERETLRDRL